MAALVLEYPARWQPQGNSRHLAENTGIKDALDNFKPQRMSIFYTL